MMGGFANGSNDLYLISALAEHSLPHPTAGDPSAGHGDLYSSSPPSVSLPPSEGIHVLPNLTVYTLPASLFSQDLRPRTIRRGIELIKQQMENNGFEEPLLWACTPMAALLLDDIPITGFIYDCDRFWHHLPVTLRAIWPIRRISS